MREKSLQAALEGRLLLALAEAQRDPPEGGARPGLHHDRASPSPLVHDRPHEGTRGEVERRVAVAPARRVFSAAADSPVRTDSSHSRPLASSSRMSAGTMSPRRSRTTSPGTSSMTSTSCARPSRSTSAVRRICECSASTACSERYSLTKPSATLMPTMIEDDARLGRFADDGGHDRRPQQEHQQEAAELPSEHAPEAGAVAAQGVGTDDCQPSPRLDAAETTGVCGQYPEDLVRRPAIAALERARERQPSAGAGEDWPSPSPFCGDDGVPIGVCPNGALTTTLRSR